MREMLDFSTFSGNQKAEGLFVTMTLKSGNVIFSPDLVEKLELKDFDCIAFSTKVDAIIKTKETKGAIIKIRKGGNAQFQRKNFIMYVFKTLAINVDVLAIKIELNEAPEKDGWYTFKMDKIQKRVPLK